MVSYGILCAEQKIEKSDFIREARKDIKNINEASGNIDQFSLENYNSLKNNSTNNNPVSNSPALIQPYIQNKSIKDNKKDKKNWLVVSYNKVSGNQKLSTKEKNNVYNLDQKVNIIDYYLINKSNIEGSQKNKKQDNEVGEEVNNLNLDVISNDLADINKLEVNNDSNPNHAISKISNTEININKQNQKDKFSFSTAKSIVNQNPYLTNLNFADNKSDIIKANDLFNKNDLYSANNHNNRKPTELSKKFNNYSSSVDNPFILDIKDNRSNRETVNEVIKKPASIDIEKQYVTPQIQHKIRKPLFGGLKKRDRVYVPEENMKKRYAPQLNQF